jgi:Ca2+-binding RTX toxin-like protein
MRLLPGGFATALCLLLCLPATGGAADPSAAAAPSCATGPATVGDTTYGTPCADLIVAPPGVGVVKAGGGDDTIVSAPIAAASAPCIRVDEEGGCYLDVGSQTFEGGPGNDLVFGERGNDRLQGGDGNDRLYGGIGDDVLEGGPGNDLLSGGFGADSVNGGQNDDYVRGDGTVDRISDDGGVDTLSYSTGVTPGFGGNVAAQYPGFPSESGEQGVRLDLGASSANGNNGSASSGGGNDDVEAGDFERIVGTPYSDYILGSEAGETIYGSGGADAILGRGGNDTLRGGADGDDLDGGIGSNDADGEAGPDNCQNTTGTTLCEGTAKLVVPRDTGKVSVGFAVASQPGLAQLYLTGGSGSDTVIASYSAASVSFALSGGSFNQDAAAQSGCSVAPTLTTCALNAPLDSIVLAGMGGADELTASGFPASVGVVLLGGEGDDHLAGGDASEDVLVDGLEVSESGIDVLSAFSGDDALLHNGGADSLLGGNGNDLFLSVSVCDGELVKGEGGRDNSSWARLAGQGVGANLASGKAGEPGAGGTPVCASGSLDSSQEIEDLEGSNSRDILYGDAGPNQLLGHKGPDDYSAGPGADTILANSGDSKELDSDPFIDCGDDIDRALIDFPQYGLDAAPVNCETVIEAAPNSFQLLPDFPIPLPTPPPPAPVVKPPSRDRTPPRTKILIRPRAILTTTKARARAVFRFSANERGSSFRCKLDRRPYRPCASPRVYMLAPGKHTVRIFAVDRAGNADRTPALLSLRVRRR